MWSRNRSRPSSKRRLTKNVKRFSSARSVCASAIGVVDEHRLRTNGPESAAVAAAGSRASARPMALAARFGVIDVITSPDRTIHHGKPRSAARRSHGKGVRAVAPWHDRGSPAVIGTSSFRPVALRPRLSTGLPFSQETDCQIRLLRSPVSKRRAAQSSA